VNLPISFKAAPTANVGQTKARNVRFVLWVFVIVLIVVASAALVADTTMTLEQRIMLFEQSGNSP